MEPITVTSLRQRVDDLKRILSEQESTILRIVDSIEEPGNDVSYRIRERLQEYFETGQ